MGIISPLIARRDHHAQAQKGRNVFTWAIIRLCCCGIKEVRTLRDIKKFQLYQSHLHENIQELAEQVALKHKSVCIEICIYYNVHISKHYMY